LTFAPDLPRPRPRLSKIVAWRPGLRLIVGVPAIAVVLAMAVAVSARAADQLRATAAADALNAAEAIVRAYVDPSVEEASLALNAPRNPAMDEQMERLVISGDIKVAKVWSRDGRVVYSNDPSIRGRRFSIDEELADAFGGQNSVEYGTFDKHDEDGGEAMLPNHFLEIYVPIRGGIDGTPIGVYELYQDARPIDLRVEDTRREVFLFALLAASALAALLALAFAGTSRVLARQNRLLRERADRDPLTGLANHGYLLRRIDEALRNENAAGGLAILDIDNFRLLNDGYGYGAGDDTLRLVARELSSVARSGQLYGRYGPDEFILADFGSTERRLLTTLQDLQAAMTGVSLRFAGSPDALPLTASTGVALAPRDGRAALQLIGVAQAALREAKTGGGSVVKIADPATMEGLAAQNTTFGVFEGLILIIDAKDRYTKFHSEDVTSHALLLAEGLGIDDETRRLVRLAGLLHDIGKVGIPDAILRKPGPLTAEEYEIVKQHVALGDAMVGAVPALEEVRPGVRHHHERWDGNGYLDRLAGKQIPLVARILAVADAYSAMTTTRPYRKALSPDVALDRIAEAAGSQLDPELAEKFVSLMRRAHATSAA
jgi:diguanylate cyclase (GGDEF)-like protein